VTIGLLQVELSIPEARSLKGKRRVLKSIKDRARSKFNISIAEIDDHDVWDRAVLAACCVSNKAKFCNQTLSKVVNLIDADHESELCDYRIEML